VNAQEFRSWEVAEMRRTGSPNSSALQVTRTSVGVFLLFLVCYVALFWLLKRLGTTGSVAPEWLAFVVV
jgi:hypothetical protein